MEDNACTGGLLALQQSVCELGRLIGKTLPKSTSPSGLTLLQTQPLVAAQASSLPRAYWGFL